MRSNVFIRKENEDKWNAIPNKSEWINALLTNSDDTSRYGVTKSSPVGPLVEVLSQDLPENIEIPRTPGYVLNDIKQLELLRDSKLEYCQDPDEYRSIALNFQEQIDELWKEYHQLKESNA